MPHTITELYRGGIMQSSRVFRGRVLGMLFLILAALPAAAQNRIIKGKVSDNKDQPVADASIQIQALDSRARIYETKTNNQGAYIFLSNAAGEYRVIVRAKGFQPEYKPSIKLSMQEDTIVDFKLTPGSEDQKLPFELSTQDLDKIKKEMAKAEKRKQSSAEVQSLFDQGLQLEQQGKYEEAIEKFSRALEKDPEQPNILGNMGDVYSKLSHYDEALALYKKAIAMKPDDADLYTNMGVILSKSGKNAESQEAFKKAADLNPSAQTFYNIGATLVNNALPPTPTEEARRLMQEAMDAFRKAVSADPNFAEAYYQLGMCQSGMQETTADAILSLQKYVQIGKKPDQVETARQLIAALQQSLKK
jgi:tetratricopeptide (TPR) repeat protein